VAETLEANLVLNATQFERALRNAGALVDALVRQLNQGLVLDVELNGEATIRAFQRQLDQLDGTQSVVDVVADTSKFESSTRGVIGDVDGEQLDVEVNADTTDFEAEVDSAVRDAGGRFVTIPVEADTTSFVSQVSDLVNPATLAGGALGATFGLAFADGLSLEAGLGRVEAQLALTEAESAAFGEAAGNLYADAYGDSIDSQLAILSDLARFELVATADVQGLEEGAGRVQDFSNTWNLESERVITSINQLVEAGLAIDLGQGLDQFTTLLQQSKVPADELLDSISEYAPFLAEAGISFDTFATAAISGGVSTSIELDKLGDVVKELQIRIGEITPDQIVELGAASGLSSGEVNELVASLQRGDAGSFEAAITTLQGIQDESDRAAFSYLLFGAQGEDVASILQNLDFGTPFETVPGAVDAAGDAINNNLGTALTSLLRTGLQPITEILASRFIPALTEVIGVVTEFLAESGLLEPILIAIGVALGAIVVAALPVSATFIGIVAAITALVGGLAALEQRFGIVSSVVGALGPIFSEIRGGIIAFGSAWNSTSEDVTSAGFPGFMERLANLIVFDVLPAFQRAGEGIREFVNGLDFSGVINAIGPVVSSIGEAFSSIDWAAIFDNIASAVNLLVDVFLFLLEASEPVVQFFLDELGPVLTEVGDIIAGVIDLVAGLLEGDWSKAWDGASEIVTSVLALIIRRITLFPRLAIRLLSGFAGGLGRAITSGLSSIGGGVSRGLGGALSAITNWVGSALGSVASFGADFISAVIGGLAGFGAAVGRVLADALGPIVSWVGNAIGAVVSFGADFVSAVVGGLAGLVVAITAPLINAQQAITGWVAGALATVVTFGVDFVSAVAGGLVGLGVAIATPLIQAQQAITNWVATAIAAVVTFGVDFVSAIAGGLVGLGIAIATPLIQAQQTITNWVATAIASVVTFGVDFVASVAGGLVGLGIAIATPLIEAQQAITNWVTTAIASVVTFGVDFVASVAGGLAGLAVAIATPLLEAATAIQTWVTETIASVVTWGVDFVASIAGGLAGLAVAIATPLLEAATAIANWIADTIASVVTWGVDLVAAAAGGVASLWTTISTFFEEVATGITGWVGDTIASVAAWGADIIATLSGGVSALWATLTTFFDEVATGITTWAADTVSSVVSWGADMIATISGGIAGLWGSIVGFFDEVIAGINGWVDDAIGAVVSFGADFISTISGGLAGLAGTVSDILGEALGSIQGWIDDVVGLLSGAVGTIQGIWDQISGILSSALPTISIPGLGGIGGVIGGLFYKGGINPRGQVGIMEGYATEVAIPLEGRYGSEARQLELLRKSGLYDLVTADIVRPQYAVANNLTRQRSTVTNYYRQNVTINNNGGRGAGRKTARKLARELRRI
jgi:phage-related protein